MTVRLPIPNTPAELLVIAEQLDKFWSAVIAGGGSKLSLQDEYELYVRAQSEAGLR